MPVYIAPDLKQVHIGEPIRFQPDVPMEQERRRICDCLMEGITDIACGLPKHTVIPYRNIAKKHYPTSKE